MLLKTLDLIDNYYCVSSSSSLLSKKTILSIEKGGPYALNMPNTLSNFDLVKWLPKITSKLDHVYRPCQLVKQRKSSNKNNHHLSTYRPLEVLYMKLIGPIRIARVEGNKYSMVIVDNISIYSWVIFLREKLETFECFKSPCDAEWDEWIYWKCFNN